jgi:L-aspartate oxidase
MSTATSLDVGPVSWRDQADVVIVGSGAAGLSAALGLIGGGRRIVVLSKQHLGDGSTAWAQGGLAAAVGPADNLASHITDTLTAGAGLCEQPAVAELVRAAPLLIRQLTTLGANFDRSLDGELALGLEGGHHARRIVHAGGDATGAELTRVLNAAVTNAAERGLVELREHTLAVDALLSVEGTVCGLRVIDADGAVGEIQARAVILATGGIGQAWPLSTNPPAATGDGLALAMRAGALIADIEFVQFHPTALVSKMRGASTSRSTLITEALRGEGARLISRDGAPVMTGVHPLGDLAPRDIVAITIHTAMTRAGSDHVLLDATTLDAKAWRHHFPSILALCVEHGIDPCTQPIPVAPAEHYSCGGVLASLDGSTTMPGLYAIGEVACTGVQGANRLASNSLTEALIAGNRVAELISHTPLQYLEIVDQPRMPLMAPTLRRDIVAATAHGSGLLRNEQHLREQQDALTAMGLQVREPLLEESDAGDHGALLRSRVETTNLHAVSTAVATAARNRRESRGCHRRSDFPEPQPQWRQHQLLRQLDGELHQVDRQAVLAA